jgi:hypothetical protein
MRKIISVFILVTASLISKAQINKGAILLGGDFTFNTLKETTPASNNAQSVTTNFSISPSFGKAIANNLILGFDLDYISAESQDVATGSPVTASKTNNYGLGFFLREYKPLGKGFSIFLQLRLNGAYSTASNNGIRNGQGYGLNLGFTPGASYAISRRVQLETAMQNLLFVGYAHQKVGTAATSYTYEHDITAGSNLSTGLSSLVLGVRFLLGN